jgi:hypothetical protein
MQTGNRGRWRAIARLVISIVLLVLVAVRGIDYLRRNLGDFRERDGDAQAVVEAYRARRSRVSVEGQGRVVRLLPDDDEGARHQRFILELAGGHTLLVVHNIDVASRLPVREEDDVAFRGEYVWNERGGLLHWTHRDPAGRRPGGWLRHEGKIYR